MRQRTRHVVRTPFAFLTIKTKAYNASALKATRENYAVSDDIHNQSVVQRMKINRIISPLAVKIGFDL